MPKSTLRLQLQLKLKPEVLIVCMKKQCGKDESFWSGKTREGFGFLSSSAHALPNLSMLGGEEWVSLAVRSMEKERKKESRSNWEQRNRSLRIMNWKRNHPHWYWRYDQKTRMKKDGLSDPALTKCTIQWTHPKTSETFF